MTPKAPLGYSMKEWELLLERDVLAEWPPRFAERWVIYVDIDGFRRLILDPEKRERVAHLYFDLARSLDWGVRHHRVLTVANTVRGLHSPAAAASAPELQKAMLDLWKKRVRIFSDSIFIFLDPRSQALADPTLPQYSLDGRWVADVAASLSRLLWRAGLPHRGGIAFGECFMDDASSVFLGRPIVDAYERATKLEWLGIVVDPASAGRAQGDFGDQPFLRSGLTASKEQPQAPLTWRESAFVLPFPAALMERREGAEVRRDQAVRGFLDAAAAVDPHNEKVLARYAHTARLWLATEKALLDQEGEPGLRSIAEQVPGSSQT